MKISLKWLRTLVNPSVSDLELSDQFTQAGLEVEAISQLKSGFNNVVVGLIITAEQHPNADRLRVCMVDVGQEQQLQIVCGASNARAGLKVAVALVDAVLPNGMQIKKAALRGVESTGMLCSIVELGLAENSQGILELPTDAPIGVDVGQYLALDDSIIDIAITPNRGDCLSVLGVAREVAAINDCTLTLSEIKIIMPTDDTKVAVNVVAKEACPHYAGRVLRNINCKAAAPIWLQERLRRSGMRPINPVVDVLNYVMLELGQPLHAFDLNKLNGPIAVRFAKQGEEITLLDGVQLKLNSADLIISDQEKPLALAGIMGGKTSEVTVETCDVFLESAFFVPPNISESARYHGLHSEASHRFERGVDPGLQQKALERVTELLQMIVGGEVAAVIEVSHAEYLPIANTILLRAAQVKRILGVDLTRSVIAAMLKLLNMNVTEVEDGWQVIPPSYRFDIQIEVDLIEEIARIYGYDKINATMMLAPLVSAFTDIALEKRQKLCELLAAQGYNEIITYGFVDPKLQTLCDSEHEALLLKNPIAADAAVMRTNLLPGLLNTLLYNQNRQQERLRFFEVGTRFVSENGTLRQLPTLAVLATGDICQKQWGVAPKEVDFFDLKNDLENILRLFGCYKNLQLKAETHPALHPSCCASIYLNNQRVGFVGRLHPKTQEILEINRSVYLFEIDLSFLCEKNDLKFKNISKFPCVERDIAIVVDKLVNWFDLEKNIRTSGGDLLQDVRLFDVYHGKGVADNQKSLALRMIFQKVARTLTEEEVDVVLQKIVSILEKSFNAKLRG